MSEREYEQDRLAEIRRRRVVIRDLDQTSVQIGAEDFDWLVSKVAELEHLRVENRRARANLEAHVSVATAEQEIEEAKFLGQGDFTVQEMRRQIVDRWLRIPLPDET